MAMTPVEIDLEFRRKDFEEIYFRNEQGSLYLAPARLPLFIASMVFGILAMVGFVAAVFFQFNWGLFGVPLLLFAYSLSRLIDHVKPVRSWKKRTLAFLDKVEKIKKHKVILGENALCYFEDSKEMIEPWKNFTKASLQDEWIELKGQSVYVFPRKSMSHEQYLVLRSVISERMKNAGAGTTTQVS